MRKSSDGEKYRNTRGRSISTEFRFPSDWALRNLSNVAVVYDKKKNPPCQKGVEIIFDSLHQVFRFPEESSQCVLPIVCNLAFSSYMLMKGKHKVVVHTSGKTTSPLRRWGDDIK